MGHNKNITVVKAVTPFTASSPTPTPFPGRPLRESLRQICQDAGHTTDAQVDREERQEHYQAGQCVQDVQEGRRLPRLHRAPRPLHLCRHRIGRLPDRPVHLDGWALTPSSRNTTHVPQRRCKLQSSQNAPLVDVFNLAHSNIKPQSTFSFPQRLL